MADEEFKNVGKEPGLVVWRIMNFKLTRIPKHQFGTFFSGDSYLIINVKYSIFLSLILCICYLLKTRGSIQGSFEWDIHFWLGSSSTLDEMATAAIKAVELDDYLGGRPVQYREVGLKIKLYLIIILFLKRCNILNQSFSNHIFLMVLGK